MRVRRRSRRIRWRSGRGRASRAHREAPSRPSDLTLRVVAPYTVVGAPGIERGLHPLCEAALARYAPQAELFDLGNSPTAYHALLSELWAAGGSFLVVEHDIEIGAHVVPEAEACPEPWCAWPYVVGSSREGFIESSLGCTRFSAEILTAVPDLMSMLPVRDWRRLDCEMSPRLRAAGFEPHVHAPPVLHHHTYPRLPEEGGGVWCACGEDCASRL